MNFYLITIFVLVFSDYELTANGQSSATVERTQSFIHLVNFDKCEGKDSTNYTLIIPHTTDYSCNQGTEAGSSINYLVQRTGGGSRDVNAYLHLSGDSWPAGAYTLGESVNLVISGPLAGKYFYLKAQHLHRQYLKKCSSDLGRSVIISDKNQLLISDNLSLEVLISPRGGFEAFRKGSSTTCTGTLYLT